MKSIIEEASSIVKAIEKAWTRAGYPREFSVRVFEDAQKSFFGLTTKQAKVGVFFEIEPIATEGTHQPQSGRDDGKQKKQHAYSSADSVQIHQQRYKNVPIQQAPGSAAPEGMPQKQEAMERKKHIAWTDDMLTAVSKWLHDLLDISNMGSHTPTLTVLDNRLIITFETPLLAEVEKTADLYRSLSYLLIGMIRSKFKKEFRFLKIVLTDAQRSHNNE